MPYGGTGTFAPPGADFPVVTLTTVSSTHFNNTINDIATGLSNCVTRDGQSVWSANLPAGGFKITGMGAGSLAGDSARVAEVQSGTYVWGGTAGGTADALTLTPAPVITAYAAGQLFRFKSGAGANTGAATVAISGLTTKAIQLNGSALISGDIAASQWYEIVYDGAAFQLLRFGYNSASVSAAITAAVAAVVSTGDVKLTIKTVADSTWVLMDDKTIGNAASAATGRANADTVSLFTLLYNNTVDADCAVSGGRGANAAADYAANKTIALPKALGRALACYGTGAGLTARTMAKALGSEDAVVVDHGHGTGTLAANSNGDHNHTEQIDTALDGAGGLLSIAQGSGGEAVVTNTPTSNVTTTNGAHTHVLGGAIANSGVSGVGANLGPRLHLNVMIKL